MMYRSTAAHDERSEEAMLRLEAEKDGQFGLEQEDVCE
jgi:hypothetical protein